MDIIFEIIFDVILDSIIFGSDRVWNILQYPKPLRYTLLTIIGLFWAGVVFILNFAGISFIKDDNKGLGIVLIVIGEIALIFVIIRVIKVVRYIKARNNQ